jgi:DNA-binding NarL/FixJ family response regulator
MVNDIRVLIVEDDPYARSLMALLLSRDWRTRVVADFGSDEEVGLRNFLLQPVNPVDVMIVDTETPVDERWPLQAAHIGLSVAHPPAVLFTCTTPRADSYHRLPHDAAGGYIVKGEILYALATAVSMAAQGKYVITPGILEIIGRNRLPKETYVIDGRVPVARFTARETDLVRLGILFGLAQRDISDELVVSTDFIGEVMGQVYDKLGLHEIFSGDTDLEDYISDPAVLERCQAILDRARGSEGDVHSIRKAPWMSTIAFHLLTVPEVEQIAK